MKIHRILPALVLPLMFFGTDAVAFVLLVAAAVLYL
jgi:hypothetical protein